MLACLENFGRSTTALRTDKAGNSAVELALVAPFLVLLVFGGIDYGRAYVESLRLTGAARAGAQVALHDPATWQDANLLEQAALEEYVGHALNSSQMQSVPVLATSTSFCACTGDVPQSCSTTCPGGELPGQFVRLSLSNDVTTTIPYPWLANSTVNVDGDAVVRVK